TPADPDRARDGDRRNPHRVGDGAAHRMAMIFNFRGIVRVLHEHEVEFVIVGGLAGAMQGAPIHTEDLDIVYSLEPPNPQRLLAALESLDGTFWGDPRVLRPGLSHLESTGHKLIQTRFGRVDCLATIEEATRFEDLVADVDWLELDGTPVRVISLPRLIEVKRQLSRPKDQLALMQLEATPDERNKQAK